MAVTVEGAFVIRDRASRTLKDIEKNAQAADRAVSKLGRSLDMVGAKKQVDSLRQVDTTMGRLSKSSEAATKALDRQTNVLEKHRRKTNDTSTALERFGKKMILVFGGLGKAFGLLRLPAIIGGISALLPVIAALGAGVVALVPQVLQLGGALGALPAVFTGMGLAMATVKLSFHGISQAMAGNKKALAALTPEARRFTETLKSWKPLVEGFRRSAQKGLFGGLDQALERLRVAAPTINRLLAMMGTRLGTLAKQAAGQFTTAGFLADFQALGNQGGTIITRMGKGVLNLVQALRHVAMAARPFTDWLTKTIYGWTRLASASALAGRQSGRLAAYFARTRTALEQFGRIAQNVWGILRALGRAAAPVGQSLWAGVERATASWKAFFQSVSGQVASRRFFDSTRNVLREVFGLVGDIGKALARLSGNQTGAATLVHGLRGLVTPLEIIIGTFQKAFGPPMVAALNQIAKTIELLTGNVAGPFSLMLRLATSILSVINRLVTAVPQLGIVIVAAFAAGKLMRMAASVRTLAREWTGVSVAATRAAEAEAVAGSMPVGGGGPIIGAGRGLFGRRKFGVPGGRIGPATEAEALGLARFGKFGKLAGAAGRFAWPLLALSAGMGAYSAQRTGNIGHQALQTGSGALTEASMGIIPQYMGSDVNQQNRLTRLATDTGRSVIGSHQVTSQTPMGVAEQRAVAGAALTGQTPTFTRTVKDYAPSWQAQIAGAKYGNQTTSAGQAAQIEQLTSLQTKIGAQRDAAKNQDTMNLLAGLQQEIAARNEILAQTRQQEKLDRRGAQAARSEGLNAAAANAPDAAHLGAATTLALRDMAAANNPRAARTIGLKRLRGDATLLKAHPELRKQIESDQKRILASFDTLGVNIEKKGGKIVDHTAAGLKDLAKVLAAPGEQVNQLVDKNMTAAENLYLEHMRSLGYTGAQAKAFVKQGEATGNFPHLDPAPADRAQAGHARGGRIAGAGLRDTVPIGPGQMAAPGELVVNRHTEAKLDRILGQQGATGRLVGGETRPHHAPMTAAQPRSGIMPGLAMGGRTGDLNSIIAQVASQYGLDPAAWAAIMYHESGLNPNSIGDHGTSFGLTQLHIGGALGNMSVAQARQYLDPTMNLQFAGAQMAAMGLGGLTGPAAISAYARRFERPSNPGAEIADAMGYYRSHSGDYAGGAAAMGGGGSPLARAMSAASAIDAHHYPYAWGGGHGRLGVPSPGTLHSNGGPVNVGYDCSGATSAVLGAAGLLTTPMVSGAFMNWGLPGYDPHGISVLSSPSHVYMMLNGQAWGTSTANPNGGAGWFPGGIRSGFAVRHIANPGAPGVMAGGRRPSPLALRPTTGGLTGFPGGMVMGATGAQANALNAAAASADGSLGFSRGGRVGWGGWFGDGGSMIADRPTLIGVGDSGRERVTVTKAGGGGGGHTFVVKIGQVVNHGGDVQREVEAAFHALARRLGTMTMSDDGDVIA